MSNELDFVLVDDTTDGLEETTTEATEGTTASEEYSKTDSEENTTSTKDKKSNWKKMAKTLKALRAENAELRKAQAKKAVANDDDDEDYDFDDDEIGFDKTEFRFFTIENPEAKEYKDQMEATLNKYPDMSFEDALALVKAKIPQESSSSNDFSSKSSNVKVRKKLADLTDEEALKLPNDKFLEHQRLKGKIR